MADLNFIIQKALWKSRPGGNCWSRRRGWALSRVLGLSLSGSERLKATRGSHAPAVRHLSLHLFLYPPLVQTARSLSFSTSARLSLHSQTSLDPGHQVNRRRDAYSRRGADRSSGWFFLPRGAMIYYMRSQHDEEYITSRFNFASIL